MAKVATPRKLSASQVALGYSIERCEHPSAYARSGNAHNPTKRYYWVAKLNGNTIDVSPSQKAVLEVVAAHEIDPC